MINQELLRTFVVAAEAASFTEAARKRHVTKSAISQQLRTLESQLGVALFERVGRSARVTERGRELAQILRHEFAAIDDALTAVVGDQKSLKGEIAIGAPRAFARVWLRPRLSDLLRQAPELHVRVSFGTPTTLERLLVTRALDLVFMVRPPVSPLIETKPIWTEQFAPYASPRYLRKHGSPSSRESFEGHRWIMFDEDLPMHDVWWKKRFGSAPLCGQIACSVASMDEMLALAEEGVGITVLPDYFVEGALRKKTLVRVDARHATVRATNSIFLAWRKNAIPTTRFQTTREALLRK